MPSLVSAVSQCSKVSVVSLAATPEVLQLSGCGRLEELKLAVEPKRPPNAKQLQEAVKHLPQVRSLQLAHGGDVALAKDLLWVLPGLRKLRLALLPAAADLADLNLVDLAPLLAVLAFDHACGQDQGGCRFPAFRQLLRRGLQRTREKVS